MPTDTYLLQFQAFLGCNFVLVRVRVRVGTSVWESNDQQ